MTRRKGTADILIWLYRAAVVLLLVGLPVYAASHLLYSAMLLSEYVAYGVVAAAGLLVCGLFMSDLVGWVRRKAEERRRRRKRAASLRISREIIDDLSMLYPAGHVKDDAFYLPFKSGRCAAFFSADGVAGVHPGAGELTVPLASKTEALRCVSREFERIMTERAVYAVFCDGEGRVMVSRVFDTRRMRREVELMFYPPAPKRGIMARILLLGDKGDEVQAVRIFSFKGTHDAIIKR